MLTLVFLFHFGLMTGCNSQKTNREENKPKSKPIIAVTNFPIRYFASRIAGDSIQILEAMPDDNKTSNNWAPDSETITLIQQADLILLNGAGFSKWLQTVSLPQGKTVITSESFEDDYVYLDSFVHRHGPKGNQSDKEIVPTTWLDISQAIQQATAIRDALVELLPEAANSLNSNFDLLKSDLEVLDEEFVRLGTQLRGKKLLTSSPELQYLARKYGIAVKPLPWKSITKLDDQTISQLKSLLKTDPSKWLIWINNPTNEFRGRIKQEFQIDSIDFDAAAFQSSEKDWIQVMKNNLQNLKSIQ